MGGCMKQHYKTLFIIVLFFYPFFAFGAPLTGDSIPYVNFTFYDSSASNGYYFAVPFSLSNNDYSPTQMIMDNKGHLVYYKRFGYGGPLGMLGTSTDFKLQPNGWITYYILPRFYVMDSTFTIRDSISARNNYNIDPHEMRILPNGNYLFLAIKDTVMDLSTVYWFGNSHNQPGSPTATVKTGVIQELDPQKNVVWEWHTNRNFDFRDADSVWLIDGSSVDWTHCNAIDVDTDGNILLSSRHLNEITKINKSTKNIMWRLGGKYSYFRFVNDPTVTGARKFTGQHYIRKQANGNYTLWDNGKYTTPPVARALEYSLNVSDSSANLVWQYIYNANMTSTAMGSMERLSNGNTLINFGFVDAEYPMFVMVNPQGDLLMKGHGPALYASYRAFNYFNIPWQIKRPQVSCRFIAGNYYLYADSGYSQYRWSTGAIAPFIQVNSTGSYFYYVPKGSGGFLSSRIYVVTNTANPCNSVTIQNETALIPDKFELIQNYPNPFNPETRIGFSLPKSGFVSLRVFDITGKIAATLVNQQMNPGKFIVDWDSGSLPSGIYYYILNAGNYSLVKKAVLIK